MSDLENSWTINIILLPQPSMYSPFQPSLYGIRKFFLTYNPTQFIIVPFSSPPSQPSITVNPEFKIWSQQDQTHFKCPAFFFI
jgi:hypothetical protein